MSLLIDERVRAYIQHKVIFIRKAATELVGHCPFCKKQAHFYVSVETQLFSCKTCGQEGNQDTFLHLMSELYEKQMKKSHKTKLWEDRKIRPKTFSEWGVGWSGSFYSIPMAKNPKGKVINIHRYEPGGKLRSTSNCKLCFMGPKEEYWNNSETLWVCEGEWDAMALWEMLRKRGINQDVIAAPGTSVCPRNCDFLFSGKDVKVVYDNDKAGVDGMRRVKATMGPVSKSMQFIHWPSSYDQGYDIRDFYVDNNFDASKITEIKSWLRNTIPGEQNEGSNEEQFTGPGLHHKKVEEVYKKWLHMHDTTCLDAMFGTIFANRIPGEPIWMFLVAPPGGMKSELLMSLADAKGTYELTTMTPQTLISGANLGGSDPSLIPFLDGKVAIVKDFTTILQMDKNARDEIFGILRDVYDGRCSKPFGNGIVRNYESRFGILSGVTMSIESISAHSVVLGERFIRFRLPSSRVSQRKMAIKKALENIAQYDIMQKELRETAAAVVDYDINSNQLPEIDDYTMERITGLAQWVADLRGVVVKDPYTRQVMFRPTPEIGTRLAKQLCKLAYGVAIYRGEHHISRRTYDILVRVARSSIPDLVEGIVRTMFYRTGHGKDRISQEEISKAINVPTSTVSSILSDLLFQKVVRKEAGKWALSKPLCKLIEELDVYQRDRHWFNRSATNVQEKEKSNNNSTPKGKAKPKSKPKFKKKSKAR